MQNFPELLNKLGYKIIKKGDFIDLLNINENYRKTLRNKKMLSKITNSLKTNNLLISALLFLALCRSVKNDKDLIDEIPWQEWISTQPYLRCDVKGLTYTGNSCYQDSVFMALFSSRNEFIRESILNCRISAELIKTNECGLEELKDIRTQLRYIYMFMHNKIPHDSFTCSYFRNSIKKCSGVKQFATTRMQDAGEFLIQLFSVFNVKNTTINRIIVFSNDRRRYVSRTKIESSPVITISAHILKNIKYVNTTSFLTQIEKQELDEDNLYKRNNELYDTKVEKTVIQKSNYLVFYPQRTIKMGRKTERIYTHINPEETINVSGNILNLMAIVVHRSLHYTVYFKCGDFWYYYNDMSGITFLNSYDNMMNAEPSAAKEGVLYFYS